MATLLTKSKINKIFITLVLALALFCSSFVGYHFNFNSISQAHAAYKEEISLITNNDFSNYSSSTKPGNPSSWTPNTPTGSDKIKLGVINVYDTLFPDSMSDYELSENPGVTEPGKTFTSDDAFYKHLMINSFEGYGRAYYESATFSLQKSSYYAINVVVKTQLNSHASIYLKGLSDETVEASITNFTTLGEWEEYTIFIATNNFAEETVTLQLWLGGENAAETSNGAVFFHKVNTIRYSQNTYSLELYYANLFQSSTKRFVNIELNGPINNNPVTNANFEHTNLPNDTNIIAGFKTLDNNIGDNEEQKLNIIPISPAEYNAEIHTAPGIVNPRSNNAPDNNYVLFMQNKLDDYQGIESSDITIKKQSYYKISVWAKSDSNTGSGGTVKLVEKDTNASSNPFEESDFTPITAKLTIATTVTANVTTNGWVQYAFYVEGHPLKDMVVNLQLWLGTPDSSTTGYVFYDNIQMQEITYKNYSTGSGTSNSTTFTPNTENNQFLVSNGNFNLTNNTTAPLTYPLTPRNWTLSNTDDNFNEKNSVSGIVNTNDTDFEKFLNDISHLQEAVANPGLTPILNIPGNTTANTSNNILVIGNTTETSQTYTSDNVNLNSTTYYKITFSVNTQFTPYYSGASIKLSTTNNTLFELKDIDTQGNWKTYTLYLYTSNESLTSTIALSLLDLTGYAFFDDINITTTSETTFNNIQRNIGTSSLENVYVVNLNQENFDLYLSNSSKALNTPFAWTGADNTTYAGTVFGIVNTKLMDSSIELIDAINPMPENGHNVLYINSGQDTYYTATGTNSYALNQGSFYKISIRIKTQNIHQEASNSKTDSNDNVLLPGASIKLTGYEEKFTAINTQAASPTNINEWMVYEFYVSPTQTLSTQVEISLGYESALTSGTVYVDNVIFEELEQAAYTQEVENIGNNKTKLALTVLATNDEEETPSDDDEFKGGNFDWLLVSSLLLSFALLIAIIGTSIRKINFRIRPKVKTSYDRRKTLEVEMNKRERIEFRKTIIDDLKQEFDSIDQEISDFLEQLDEEADQLKQKAAERKEYYNTIKQGIIIEIANATSEFNEESKDIADEKEKQAAQANFEKRVKKLQQKQLQAEIKEQEKDRKLEQLKVKRERYLQKQEYRKTVIREEIERIEREIEEIAREEEIMWSEYRKAKEEAKKQKLEYVTKKRAEAREKRESKKVEVSKPDKTAKADQQPTENPEVTITESDKVESDDVIDMHEDNNNE